MAPETPKAVSSRLLTMKFMQRAVASAATPESPDSKPPSNKKRRLENSPAQGRVDAFFDQASIQAAINEQEAIRQAALAKHSASDSHWILKTSGNQSNTSENSKPSLNILYVGYGDIDSANESGGNEDEPQSGRTATRKYKESKNKKSESLQKSQDNSDDSSSDDSSGDSDDSSGRRKSRHSGSAADLQGQQNRSRSQSQTRHTAASAKVKELRDKRKKKDIHLNKITSISSGGGKSASHGTPNSQSQKCYNCQQPGHKASECPRPRTKNPSRKP